MTNKKKKSFYIILTFLISGLLFSFQPSQPKVFVIGDSISMFYGPYLKESLKGFLRYDRKGGNGEGFEDLDHPAGSNGGDSNMVFSYLKELEEDPGFSTDYLLVNCGLHDIKTDPKTGKVNISAWKYKDNLKHIVSLSHKMKVKMIWVNTTPVVDSIHNSRMNGFHRYNKDVIKYNEIARNVMQKNNIPVIDLYKFTQKFIPEAYHDHVHFNKEIREKQADFIAGNLVRITNKTKS